MSTISFLFRIEHIAEIMLDRGRSSAQHGPDRCAAGGACEGAGRRSGARRHHRQRAQGVLRRARSRISRQARIETKKFLERLYFALNDTQYRMGKPTIAAVDGAVRAGGMTIAISCDMIIAGDALYLRLSRIDVGLIRHSLRATCRGWSASTRLLDAISGEPFDAATAFRMGLLSEVVPKGPRLWLRGRSRASSPPSPIVMKIGRDAFMRAVDADFRRSVENAAESFALVATTEDCQEGLSAFVEKRTPNYRGR